ncbi:hypothetical protein KIPB_013733, partial [Kipferlia bialata]
EVASMEPLKPKAEAAATVITWDDIHKHQSRETGYWTVVKDKVYDVTRYIYNHPGGAKCITDFTDADIGKMASKVHGFISLDKVLDKLWIGMIEGGQTSLYS